MRIIYRLPKWCAAILLGLIIYIIYCEVRVAKATNIFEVIKYSRITDNVKFTVMGLDSYTIFLIIGVVFGIIVSILRKQMISANTGKAVIIAILFIVQAFVGIKLFYGIEKVVANESWEYFSVSGFSLYGAIFFSMIFIPIIAKLFKIDTKLLFDYLISIGLVVLICVKFGCFTVGCCSARMCNILGSDILLPVQLFEALWLLVVLQIMFDIENKRLFIKESDYIIGANFFITVFLYGIFRLCIEFIKDTQELFYGITINQVFAVVGVIISIVILRKWNILSLKKYSN